MYSAEDVLGCTNAPYLEVTRVLLQDVADGHGGSSVPLRLDDLLLSFLLRLDGRRVFLREAQIGQAHVVHNQVEVLTAFHQLLAHEQRHLQPHEVNRR